MYGKNNMETYICCMAQETQTNTVLSCLSFPCPDFFAWLLCPVGLAFLHSSSGKVNRVDHCWVYGSKTFGATLVHGMKLNSNLNGSRLRLHWLKFNSFVESSQYLWVVTFLAMSLFLTCLGNSICVISG